jgi:TatD DNase family protein
MSEKGVGAIVVGTTSKTSREAVDFAHTHDNIWATVGYHPEHFSSTFFVAGEDDAETYNIQELRNIISSSKKVVAIGETGLDFFRIDEGINRLDAQKKQENGLRDHIALASEVDLPLVIHCRDAFSRLIDIIKEEQATHTNVRGVVHCFTGDWDQAQALMDLHFRLSFTGIITFPEKKDQNPELSMSRVIERMPLQHILIETDSPWLTPMPHRGKQNEPINVEFVAKKIAELRHSSFDEIVEQTTINAQKLFKLD